MEQHNLQQPNSKQENKSPDKKRGPRKPKKITESYLHNSGLYYLERFASSSENFRKVMMRKVQKSCYAHKDQDIDKCAELVDALVLKFQNLELLNDESYARSMVTSMRRRGKSRRYIIGNLKTKGLNADIVERELQRYADENLEDASTDEFEAALTFARKKRIGPFRGIKEEAFEKELATLARAGFSYDIAQKVLNYEEIEL